MPRLLAAVLLVAAFGPTAAGSSERSDDIGRIWAQCSVDAKILEEFFVKDNAQKDALRKVRAIFGVYSAAVLGEESSWNERTRIYDEFLFSKMQLSPSKLKDEMAKWWRGAKHRTEICTASFDKYRDRYRPRAQELLASGAERKPTPSGSHPASAPIR